MIFNIQKFLTENKLTGQSQMREDDNTGLTMPVGSDDDDFDDGEEEKEVDDYSTANSYDGNYEVEPTANDMKGEEPRLTGIHKKHAQLRDLEDKKDALLMQLKGEVISLDQYKQEIGNIPQQIKKLRTDISKAMNVTLDTDDDMSADDHIG